MKKLLLLLVVATFGISAFGQPIGWTNGNGTGLWTDQDNWDAGFSPDFPGDEGVFDGNISSADCLITGNQTVGLLTAGVGGADYEGTITIQSGGSLTTTGPRWAAIGWTRKCTLVVEAGATFTTASHLWLAFNNGAKSYIDLYGTINVGEMFGVNFADNGGTADKEALLTVHNGGVLNLAQLTGAAASPTNSFNTSVADGSLSILGGGTVNLPGDRTGDFAAYVTAGKIVTPGGNAVITYDAVADLTSVTSNAAPLSSKDFNTLNFEVYPNPTTSLITVKSKTPISKINLYNILGHNIIEEQNTSKIDISNLSSGYYLLKAEDAQGNVGIKKVLKN
jgi:hypothetical protein